MTERWEHVGESGSRERRLGVSADVRHGDAELAPDEIVASVMGGSEFSRLRRHASPP